MSEWSDAEQHVERAHELFEAGRLEEAEAALREAIAMDPLRADWRFNLGLTLEAAGRDEDALTAFREAHELDEDEAQPLVAMGVLALRLGRLEDAVRWLDKAAAVDPSRPEPSLHRITAYARLGRHEDAETMFYLALQTEGCDEPAAQMAIAQSLLERGMVDRAIWCLREASRKNPALPGVHAALAEAIERTGRLERARQSYLRELREQPGDVDTLLDLGRLLVRMNRLGEASEKFRRVLEMESDNAPAHYELGVLARREGRNKEALAAFRLVLRLEPAFPGARCAAAEILLEQGDIGGAAALLLREVREVQRGGTLTIEELDELGELLVAAQRYDEAATIFRRVAQARPDDAEAHHRLGAALLLSGEREEGMRATRRALRLRPDHGRAMQNLAIASIEEGRWRRVRVFTAWANAIDPEDAGVRRLRARLRLRDATLAATFLWRWTRAALLAAAQLLPRRRRA